MHIQTFQWAIDLNGDGQFSLWEIWETLRWVFRMPGSLVIELLGQSPFVAHILNIKASAASGYSSLDGLLSKAISFLFWLPLLMGILSAGSKPKRRHSYLDENPSTQPLLLPMPKDYPISRHYH